MKIIFNLVNFSIILLFVISCEEENIIPPDEPLTVMLAASSNEIILGNSLEISINVKNADSLFAISFQLNYDSDLFIIGSSGDSVTVGNLFTDPFPENYNIYLSSGEISVGFAEWGNIKHTASGTACSIIFSTIDNGTGTFYISLINMIKKDGSEIIEYPPIDVESLVIKVIE